MAYHCYHDQPCPACGRFYVRYAADVPCPACGGHTAPVYELVDELVHYARLTLTAQGTLELSGFAPVSRADAYVVYGYELLEASRLHPELPPELIAGEALRSYRLERLAGEAAHWRGFFLALLSRWHEVRHQPLPQPTAAGPQPPPPPREPPAPPVGVPPAPPSATERHLYLKGRLGAKDH